MTACQTDSTSLNAAENESDSNEQQTRRSPLLLGLRTQDDASTLFKMRVMILQCLHSSINYYANITNHLEGKALPQQENFIWFKFESFYEIFLKAVVLNHFLF
ncbi:hypothetical protein XENOCAPTIV_004643 [Xenoophorus captivus]|uniref:Uncharacterized protein n=1 Tax=Xenoophorus captivus TaxID=1517983 RepID=A0ABV0RNQ7_9TELE